MLFKICRNKFSRRMLSTLALAVCTTPLSAQAGPFGWFGGCGCGPAGGSYAQMGGYPTNVGYRGGWGFGGYTMAAGYGPGIWSGGTMYGNYGCNTCGQQSCNSCSPCGSPCGSSPCGGSPCGVNGTPCGACNDCSSGNCPNGNCGAGYTPPIGNGPTPEPTPVPRTQNPPKPQPTYRDQPPTDEFVPVRPQDPIPRGNPNSTNPNYPMNSGPMNSGPMNSGPMNSGSNPATGGFNGNTGGQNGFAPGSGSSIPSASPNGSTVPAQNFGNSTSPVPPGGLPNSGSPFSQPITPGMAPGNPGSNIPPIHDGTLNSNRIPLNPQMELKEDGTAPNGTNNTFKMPIEEREPAPLDPTPRSEARPPVPQQEDEKPADGKLPESTRLESIDTELRVTADVKISRRRVVSEVATYQPVVVRVNVQPQRVQVTEVNALAHK